MIGVGILIFGLLVVVVGVGGMLGRGAKSDSTGASADEEDDEDDSGRLMEKRVLYRRGFWRL